VVQNGGKTAGEARHHPEDELPLAVRQSQVEPFGKTAAAKHAIPAPGRVTHRRIRSLTKQNGPGKTLVGAFES
jgi:hypothetical protein